MHKELEAKLAFARSRSNAGLDTDFRKGARAMFDALLFRAANNYHGNAVINGECQKENRIIESWAHGALSEVSPEDCAEWHTITELMKELVELRTKVSNV